MAEMWKLLGEHTLVGPQAGDSVEYAVVALLPSGPRTRFLERALADDVVAAVHYLQDRRGIHHVCVQCYQRCDDGETMRPTSGGSTPTSCGCAPAGNRGWSFFLIEKTMEDGHAAVQAYLFQE